jgi:hypothetical protein
MDFDDLGYPIAVPSRHLTATESVVLPPVIQVSEMTTTHVVLRPKSIPIIAAIPVVDLTRIERRARRKRIAALADPMQSEIVRSWLKGSLRPPR